MDFNGLIGLINEGDVRKVATALEKHSELLNQRDPNNPKHGKTLMYHAMDAGNEAMALMLLNHFSGDINLRLTFSCTVLDITSGLCFAEEPYAVFAARRDLPKVLEVLLKQGFSINSSDKDGRTPLYAASGCGHVDVVAMLIKHDAAVNQAHDNGTTPLFMASQNGHHSVVERLLAAHAAVDQARSDEGLTPLFMASAKGYEKVVKRLLAAGAAVGRPDLQGATPLLMASQNGHQEVVAMLLAAHAAVDQVDNKGITPLLMASQNGHLAVVERLLAAGATVNQAHDNGTTPLFMASAKGYEKVVKRLLAAGAAVDQADNKGITPLFMASAKGYEKVVKRLLAAGAAVDQINFGQTALSIAARKSYDKVVTILEKCKDCDTWWDAHSKQQQAKSKAGANRSNDVCRASDAMYLSMCKPDANNEWVPRHVMLLVRLLVSKRELGFAREGGVVCVVEEENKKSTAKVAPFSVKKGTNEGTKKEKKPLVVTTIREMMTRPLLTRHHILRYSMSPVIPLIATVLFVAKRLEKRNIEVNTIYCGPTTRSRKMAVLPDDIWRLVLEFVWLGRTFCQGVPPGHTFKMMTMARVMRGHAETTGNDKEVSSKIKPM